MPLPPSTPADIEALVLESGFPFELEVGLALQNAGYDVRLSHQYFNATRQRTVEVDIRATKDFETSTSRAGRIELVLELAVECKDNGLPYVLFGFPTPTPPAPGMLDSDVYYNKVRSFQDVFPNQLALISLGDERLPASVSLKSQHHQFAGATRFHQASAVEVHNGKLKFNVSERLREALHGLAGYVQFTQSAIVEANKGLKATGMPHDPTIWVTFLLLVHRDVHYRYTGPSSLAPAPHTTLFTSLHDGGSSMAYAVDFVNAASLPAALALIESTFTSVSQHLAAYLEASPHPIPARV